MTPLLEVRDLDVVLGDYQVLWGAHLAVEEGEVVALLGPNGAGKSTLMNSVSGLVRPRAGRVIFAGRPIDGLPAHRIVGQGLAHVLERRRLFPYLTVRQNVWLGGWHPAAQPDVLADGEVGEEPAPLQDEGQALADDPVGGQPVDG